MIQSINSNMLSPADHPSLIGAECLMVPITKIVDRLVIFVSVAGLQPNCSTTQCCLFSSGAKSPNFEVVVHYFTGQSVRSINFHRIRTWYVQRGKQCFSRVPLSACLSLEPSLALACPDCHSTIDGFSACSHFFLLLLRVAGVVPILVLHQRDCSTHSPTDPSRRRPLENDGI